MADSAEPARPLLLAETILRVSELTPRPSPGFDALGPYVETFWLPVLGPTSLCLLRRLGPMLARRPGGFDLRTGEVAAAIGLRGHGPGGGGSLLYRTIKRLVSFDAARWLEQDGPWALEVRRVFPLIPKHSAQRLPSRLRLAHEQFMVETIPSKSTVRG